jgi:heme exporter protein A
LTALLSATALCIGRGDRRLVSDLDFALQPGDVLHLRGRNGAGKSSLIEVLVGLRPPQSGALHRAAGEAFHWVGHRNALNPDLTLRENLDAWCALNDVARDAIAPALERMGLSRLHRRPARTLSAGQRRRAALARLLIVHRPLWLLDEPLSGLDGEGLAGLGRMMNEHIGRQGAIVVTSHQALPGKLPRVTVIDLG